MPLSLIFRRRRQTTDAFLHSPCVASAPVQIELQSSMSFNCPTPMRRPYLLLALLVLSGVPAPTAANFAESPLSGILPAQHKRIFDEYNAFILGDLSVARTVFKGSVAAKGDANLNDFDIGASKTCDADSRSLVVAGSLTARAGAIHNGYTVFGRRSSIDYTVRMPCSTRVERYDVKRNGDIDFDAVKRAVLHEGVRTCLVEPTGNVTVANGTMEFDPGEKGYSCYTHFAVPSSELRLTREWRYVGDDFYRNLIITVRGSKLELKDLAMVGFNPRRTLVVFCAILGSQTLLNVRLEASVMAATSALTTTDALVNGSIIAGSLRGSIAAMNAPYVTC